MKCGCGKDVLFTTNGRCGPDCPGKPARPVGYYRERQKRKMLDPEWRAAYNAYQRDYRRRERARKAGENK